MPQVKQSPSPPPSKAWRVRVPLHLISHTHILTQFLILKSYISYSHAHNLLLSYLVSYSCAGSLRAGSIHPFTSKPRLYCIVTYLLIYLLTTYVLPTYLLTYLLLTYLAIIAIMAPCDTALYASWRYSTLISSKMLLPATSTAPCLLLLCVLCATLLVHS